ncbi:broad-complex core protein isoform 6 [Lasius niger]|uniref:Broad-complex core protein isoform 6 n=1 Tax=Lasius niger TaxID=67767 RepID=A0A0J7JXY4_LASNI|nr:broad-complex core protein isoform 6 [Lasius niger]
MSSQICLKWNSFLSNIATSFESLWEEEGLVDVTLASDGQCLTAHKVILSASSPFFKKVFQVSFAASSANSREPFLRFSS